MVIANIVFTYKERHLGLDSTRCVTDHHNNRASEDASTSLPPFFTLRNGLVILHIKIYIDTAPYIRSRYLSIYCYALRRLYTQQYVNLEAKTVRVMFSVYMHHTTVL